MILVRVNEIPERKLSREPKLQNMIREFMDSDLDFVEVVYDPSEYKNAKTCYTTIYTAIKRSGRRCKICERNNHIYLKKIKEP